MANILIVEDQDDFGFILQDVLTRAGYANRWAHDGAEGLELVKEQRPDLILLDWNMPELDGEGFCRRLRSDAATKDIPVILLTVRKGEPEELEALHFGADDFVNKPFQPEELLARVRAALRRVAA